MTDSYRLLPGLHLVRRDADHLQLGVDPPRCAVLRDLSEVRRLVDGLAAGRLPQRPGAEVSLALAAIIDAGLLVEDDTATRRERLRAARVQVDAAPDVKAGITAQLREAGVAQRARPSGVDVLLLVTTGEPESAAASTS